MMRRKNLEAPVLEQIRLISNLETDQKKLIQIVLQGSPELMRMLNKRMTCDSSAQRITDDIISSPMNFEDTLVTSTIVSRGWREEGIRSPFQRGL